MPPLAAARAWRYHMNSIVIARYNESLDWVVNIPSDFEIYIYNKGVPVSDARIIDRADHIIDRQNVGRESETYIHHMLTKPRKDNSFTVFTQGDPFTHSPDFLPLLQNWRQWDSLQPLSWQWQSDHNIPPATLLAEYERRLGGRLRVRPERFSLSSWSPPDFIDEGALATSRDYCELHGSPREGENVASDFLRKCGLDELADKASAHSFGVFCYGAIFAVRNDLIANWPRQSLEITYQATLGRAVYGYMLERMWLHFFGAEFDTPVASRVPAEQPLPRQAAVELDDPKAEPSMVERDDDIVSFQVEELRDTAEKLRIEISELREALKTQAVLDQRAIHDVASAIRNIPGVVRPKRLFISTGYFATAVAATLASQQGTATDDYLLITIDRQAAEGNTQWAYQMSDRWAAVHTVGHHEYYENNAGFSNPFNCNFDEVYSSHFHMAGFVRHKFPASRYAFYEEGLSTYSQALNVRVQDNNTRFYALSPKIARAASIVSQPVDVKLLTQLLEKSINCYSIPIFEKPHNIVMLAMGIPPNIAASRSHSFEACEPAAKMLRAAGFDVWLKPHPRAPIDDLFGNSSLAAAGVRLLETDAPLIEPVILANRQAISAVVSVYSSFLVHSYPLFDIPAFRIRSPVMDRMQAIWKSLQDSSVPDVDMLLGATPDSIPSIARSFHNTSVNQIGKLGRRM
jgi:hypothetical protein